MTHLPNKLPPGPGFLRAIHRKINEIIDYLRSLTPHKSANMTVSHTSQGTTWTASPKGEGGKSKTRWM